MSGRRLGIVAVLAASLLMGNRALGVEFSAAEVYRRAADSVVLIAGTGSEGRGSLGSGSIIARGGLVLTNNHVVSDRETARPYESIVVYNVRAIEETSQFAPDLHGCPDARL